MPLFYSLGQHRALQLVQDELWEDEAPLVFLDDMHLVTCLERTTTVFATLHGVFVDGGRHPPQPRQSENLEFGRGETSRVQNFAEGC